MLLLLVIGIGVIIIIPLPENSYALAIIDKHEILTGTKSPKMVLVGGSNLAFGIDSGEIEDEFHISVVNMGLHAGFGLGRMLDDVSPFLNSGDILLIAPEFEHFTSGWNGSEEAYELIFDAKQYRLLWSSYYRLPSGFFNYCSTHLWGIIKRINIIKNFLVYLRDGFNEYGDYTKHLEMGNLPFISIIDLGFLNLIYLNHFFQFVDDFSIRGITVVLSYPCYEEQSFRNSTGLIQELDTAFRAKENLLVISSPESYCFPTSYFFDTNYHLNKEGRYIRTGQLIHDLQASGIFNTQDTQR
jgi:hypothetical protein